jgi:hypothetical protein
VESSKATILSRIVRLRLSYDGAARQTPASLILKTGLPERDARGQKRDLDDPDRLRGR